MHRSGRRIRRFLITSIAALATLVVALTAALAFPESRPGVVRAIAQAYLATKGLHADRLDVSMNDGVLLARDVLITENGGLFFSSDTIRVTYGAPGRALGISSIALYRPHLVIRRAADGSYDVAKFFGGGGKGRGGAPMLASVRIRDGRVDVVNAFSPAAPGRAFSLDRIRVDAAIAQGARSRGTASMMLSVGRRSSPIEIRFDENDVSRVARATIGLHNVALAPIVDSLVSSSAFVVEDGVADLTLHAYAAGWNDAGGPQWRTIGSGSLRDGRLRTLPFAVPIRDVNGPLSVFDGTLEFPGLTADAAGVPMSAAGTVALLPTQNLGLRVAADGPLSRIRKWLPFSASLPLEGRVALAAALSGPAVNPHVSLELHASRALRYANVPIEAFRTNAYYADGHVALRDTFASYARASLFGDGDIDLTTAPVAGQFILLARGQSDRIPWIASIDPSGTTRAGVALSGPLMKLGGSGFAMATGNADNVRVDVTANPDHLAIESLIEDARGGEAVAVGAVDRTNNVASVDVYARDLALRTNGLSVSLAGVTKRPIGLPRASATISGYAVLRGAVDTPVVAVRLSARKTEVADVAVGRIMIGGAGSADGFRIERLAVSGPSARVEANGAVRLLPAHGKQKASIAGVLEGSGRIDLGRLHLPGTPKGTVDGSFASSIIGSSWLASARVEGFNASVSGVPVRGVRAVIGQVRDRVVVYGATAQAAGGEIGAQGSVPGVHRGTLRLTARGVDLATLRDSGMPLRGGVISGSARIEGTATDPSVFAAAALSGGDVAGRQMSGDTQAAYKNDRLDIRGGRVVADGNAAAVDGSIAGVRSGNPTIALDISVPEADLASLSSAIGSSAAPLSGIASANVRASGSATAPTIEGNVVSDAGTVRGVAFGDLRAAFSAAPGSVDVRSATVRFGSSRIAVAGSLAQGAARLRASSAHVNLDDFNDFFNGKDVLEGHGSLDVAIAATPARANASGFVHIADSRFNGIPLGSVDGRLRPLRGGAAATIVQAGSLAESNMDVALFPSSSGAMHAYADGTIRDVNLSALAPYVRAEDQGISGTGRASLHAVAYGGKVRGAVSFAVDRARVRAIDLREATGSISVDPRTIRLNSVRIAIDGASVDGRGTIDRTGRLAAHAVANVRNLNALERFSRHPLSMNGAAVAYVDAAGTFSRPTVRARMTATQGEIDKVAFDTIAADGAFQRGHATANGVVTLADGHGDLRLSADLPVRSRPLRIGPNDRRVKLTAQARGVGIASLNSLLGDYVAGGGVLDGIVEVTGTAGRPAVSGSLHVRGASLRSRFDKVPLTGLDADVALTQTQINLQRLHATAGAGSVDALGSAHIVPATALRPAAGLQYAFSAALNDAQVDVPNYLTGTVNAHLGLTKSAAVPYVFGDVAFSHASVPFASVLALASGRSAGPATGATIPGLPPLRPHHVIVYGGSIFGDKDGLIRPTPAPAPHPAALAIVPSTVGLNLRVVAADDVGISGLLNVIGKGEVTISGDTSHPVMDGTLTAVRGRAGFLNTSFDLLDGWLTFRPQEGLIPSVNADAITRTEDADITVSVYGRVDQLHTDLQSDPPMNRDAIVATMLRIPQLNSALASSHGQQQAALGVSPQNLVSGAVAGQILGALNIGLEQVFNLEEIDFGLDPFGRPSLELRKQVSPRAYTLYRTTFTVPPAEALGIAYQVRRALQVELTQSQMTPGILASYALPQTSITVKMTFH